MPTSSGAHLGVLALEHALPLLLIISTPRQLQRRDSHWEPPITGWSPHTTRLGLAELAPSINVLPTSITLVRQPLTGAKHPAAWDGWDTCLHTVLSGSRMCGSLHRAQTLLGREPPAPELAQCPLPSLRADQPQGLCGPAWGSAPIRGLTLRAGAPGWKWLVLTAMSSSRAPK